MAKADLHTHTTFSDGALTPAALVALGKEVGLDALAITDHDTVDGVPEGIEAGDRLGMLVIPGVEINTEVQGAEVHMLGYFLDVSSEALAVALRNLREGRLRRAEQMVSRLQAVGVPVRLERVLALAGDEGSVGRPHLAQALVELGVATDLSDAFDKYLSRGRVGYMPRPKFTPEQAIATIRAAGGVPVLAHPALSRCDDQIRAWVRAGMRGLEVEHNDQGDEQTMHYRRIARDLGLVATAGSDFHSASGGRVTLGSRTCGWEVIDRLRAEAERVRAEARESATAAVPASSP